MKAENSTIALCLSTYPLEDAECFWRPELGPSVFLPRSVAWAGRGGGAWVPTPGAQRPPSWSSQGRVGQAAQRTFSSNGAFRREWHCVAREADLWTERAQATTQTQLSCRDLQKADEPSTEAGAHVCEKLKEPFWPNVTEPLTVENTCNIIHNGQVTGQPVHPQVNGERNCDIGLQWDTIQPSRCVGPGMGDTMRNLEKSMPSEISQTQKTTLPTSLICEIPKGRMPSSRDQNGHCRGGRGDDEQRARLQARRVSMSNAQPGDCG